MRTEAGLAVAAALLLAVWVFLSDRLGLWHAGPIAYANHEACDAWYYFGLSVWPGSGLITAPGGRPLSRVMYFGIVHELKLLLPWLGISLLSFLTFLPVTLAALYVGLRSAFTRTTSALAVLMLGTTPLMLNMMSTTYVTVAAIAYGSCMLACLMWASRLGKDSRTAANVSFAAAGLFFAWAVNANVIAAEFFIFFCLLSFVYARSAFLRWAVRAGSLFVVGFAAGTLATLVVASALGLPFLSPLSQVRAAVLGVGAWQYPGWQLESVGLTLAVLGSILLVFALGQVRRSKPPRSLELLIAAVAAAATCLYNLFAALALGDQGLVYDYFYFLLLPALALAFCAAFDEPVRNATPGQRAVLFAVTVGFIIAFNAAMALFDGVKGLFFSRPYAVPYAMLAVLAVLALVGNKARFATACAAVAAVAVLMQTSANQSLMGMYYHPREPMQRHTEMAESAVRFIFRNIDAEPVLWISRADDFRLPLPIVRSLQHCRFAGAFPDALPNAEANAQPDLAPGRTVVILDGAALGPEQIQAALRPHGYRLDVKATQRFALDPAQSVQITVGTVRER